MKFVKPFKINEVHPGAKTMDETINFFIQRGEENGIPVEITRDAIRLIIKQRVLGKPKTPFIKRGSSLHNALTNIESCIHTMQDDGYPEEWIYRELRKFV